MIKLYHYPVDFIFRKNFFTYNENREDSMSEFKDYKVGQLVEVFGKCQCSPDCSFNYGSPREGVVEEVYDLSIYIKLLSDVPTHTTVVSNNNIRHVGKLKIEEYL